MRITLILTLLLLVSFISGCWYAHIGEDPESLGNIDLLQSFIGQESESVVREFGLPDEFLSDGDQRFMLYSASSSDTNIAFIVVFPYVGNSKTLHCLRFELDSDNVVKEYRLNSGAPYLFESFSSCREAFWSRKERENLKTKSTFRATWEYIEAEKAAREEAEVAEKVAREFAKLEQNASKGDADAQLSLFRNVISQDTNRALGWLCRSADLGNQEARSIVAKIYEYGGYIWIRKGHIQQNYKLAYVWHALSGLYDEEDLQFFADRHLNSAELSEAKNMLREWQPGQCEKDLGLVSHIE